MSDVCVSELISIPDLKTLLKTFDISQYCNIIKPKPCGNITTKADLKKIIILPNTHVSKTSGTTGMPVIIPKTSLSMMWFNATNLRELAWRGWNLTDKTVAILARFDKDVIVGNMYQKKIEPIDVLQKFLEEYQPIFLYTYPSIIENLDLKKIPSILGIKSVGEPGGTNYSSEETGTIALQCPDYPHFYHIMENIIVENDPEYGILVTDLTNPILNRYALGDVVELGEDNETCPCGRKLSIIKKIYGRTRGMLILPKLNTEGWYGENRTNILGDKVWPTYGEKDFLKISTKIVKHQIIQKSLYDLEIKLWIENNEKLTNQEELNFKNLLVKSLRYDHLDIKIVYEDVFKMPVGKFNPFLCEI